MDLRISELKTFGRIVALTKTTIIMNKSFIKFIPVLGFIAMMATSCADDCCKYAGVNICESDFNASLYGGLTWEEWKEAADAAGLCE